MSLAIVVNGLHELDLPRGLVMAWRAALIIIACLLLGGFWQFLRAEDQPTSRRLFMIALVTVTARFVLVNVERFDLVVYAEGLLIDTVWLALASAALAMWVHERRTDGPLG